VDASGGCGGGSRVRARKEGGGRGGGGAGHGQRRDKQGIAPAVAAEVPDSSKHRSSCSSGGVVQAKGSGVDKQAVGRPFQRHFLFFVLFLLLVVCVRR